MIGGGNARLPTVCKICGGRDSLEHVMGHAGKQKPPDKPEELITFLVELATVASVTNPHISTPHTQEVSWGMELKLDSEGAGSDEDSLSFDEDIV